MFYLDFDGVICDSIHECFYSSYYTLKGFDSLFGNSTDLKELAVREKDFLTFRPFVRSGEDYILVQEMIDKGLKVSNQDEFDRMLKAQGSEEMKLKKEKLYRTRNDFLEKREKEWLNLNPLFQGLKEPLQHVSQNQKMQILSTKKPEFIQKILMHWGISWPMDRIHFSSADISKTKVILSLGLPGESILIDDHKGHLSEAIKNGISGRLAGWGYVDHSITVSGLETWSLTDFITFLAGQ